MALTSTMYSLEVLLSDADRNVYETVKCMAALHPSESKLFLATRILAYCLEYEDGLTFTKGLSDPSQPAIWSLKHDGTFSKWIEVGQPDAGRLHKAAKAAERVAVYTHRDPHLLMRQLQGERIFQGEVLPVYSFDAVFLESLSELLERRSSLILSVSDAQLYLDIGGSHLSSAIEMRPAIGE